MGVFVVFACQGVLTVISPPVAATQPKPRVPQKMYTVSPYKFFPAGSHRAFRLPLPPRIDMTRRKFPNAFFPALRFSTCNCCPYEPFRKYPTRAVHAGPAAHAGFAPFPTFSSSASLPRASFHLVRRSRARESLRAPLGLNRVRIRHPRASCPTSRILTSTSSFAWPPSTSGALSADFAVEAPQSRDHSVLALDLRTHFPVVSYRN